MVGHGAGPFGAWGNDSGGLRVVVLADRLPSSLPSRLRVSKMPALASSDPADMGRKVLRPYGSKPGNTG